MKIYNFDTIPSTNDFAESIKRQGEDALITALVQTNGHGSKGRSFISDRGGLYVTMLRFYDDLPSSQVFRVMVNAAVAVCRTMEEFSLRPEIKWPNDVFVQGKKICGTLINNTFSGAKISSSVVGIGINIQNELPPELKEIAINMLEAGAKDLAVEKVRSSLVKNLQKEASMQEYKSYIRFFGKKIFLLEGEEKREVVAVDVDELGRLVVEENGVRRCVAAAEVSLRFH